MKRSTAQSISRNLGYSLHALEHSIAHGKSLVRACKPIMPELAADLQKTVKKQQGKRARQAVLQWKLKKVMAGNASYLTDNDLNALRAFQKSFINMVQDEIKVVKEVRAFKAMRHGERVRNKAAQVQRELRQVVIQYGKDMRTRKDDTAPIQCGWTVRIKPVHNWDAERDFPAGCCDDMANHVGLEGKVIGSEYFGKVLMHKVETTQDNGKVDWYWWSGKQLEVI